MVVMAEKRPLYAQLPDMPAGKVLEDVFAQAAGFSLDGEGLLEAMVTGQIGSLHFVAIAKQWAGG